MQQFISSVSTRKMTKRKAGRPEKPEMTTMQEIGYYIKEIAGALALIAFGCTLYYFADDISAWFGELVQNAFNELLRMMGYESPA